MAFTIPNEADAFAAAQAAPDKVDLDILAAGYNGNGVIKGAAAECVVTAQTTPDMTVAVAAGIIAVGSVMVSVIAGNVTITAANATNPRFDLIVIDNAGVKSAVAGTSAAAPVFPAIPANSVVLAAVYVPANDTTMAANQITDKRILINPYGVLTRSTAAVTVVNTITETDLIAYTVLGGLMGTTRKLRVTLIGDLLNNSGATTTLNLKVSHGGTVVWADITGTLGNGSSRRPFYMQFDIANINSASVQYLAGFVLIGSIGNATTGTGDLAAAGYRETVFSGAATSTINTTNDAVVRVQATHGNAATTIDIRMQNAVIELI